jgi:hypothetical protein
MKFTTAGYTHPDRQRGHMPKSTYFDLHPAVDFVNIGIKSEQESSLLFFNGESLGNK